MSVLKVPACQVNNTCVERSWGGGRCWRGGGGLRFTENRTGETVREKLALVSLCLYYNLTFKGDYIDVQDL